MRLLPRCAALGLRFAGFTLGVSVVACSPGPPPSPTPSLSEAPSATGFTPIPGIPAGSSLSTADLKPGDQTIVRNSIHAGPPSALREDPTPKVAVQVHRLRAGGTPLTIITFDGRTHHLAVVDNERGPGTGATTSQAAAKSAKALAAINAGFFTPEGKPLGLVIEDGTKFGTLNSSSLGAGIYSYRPGAASLIRRTSWSRQSTPQHLLQSGPFLVEHKAAVSGLSNSRPRPRSFLLWDGHQGWAIGHAGSATLATLASTLASQPVPGFTIKSALNLDGGTSSDLWIASSLTGGPASTRRFWNKPVRNYLVLQANRP